MGVQDRALLYPGAQEFLKIGMGQGQVILKGQNTFVMFFFIGNGLILMKPVPKMYIMLM